MYHWMMYDQGWADKGWEFAPAFLLTLAPFFIVGIFAFVLWALFWKAWALWLAARRGEKLWFGALLVINTLGLLEIIYIFLVAKRKDTKEELTIEKEKKEEEV